MATIDGYPEYDEIIQGGAPQRDCGGHRVPESCVVTVYPKHAGRRVTSACPRCLVIDQDVEHLLACWDGRRWVEGDVWGAWRQVCRDAFASDFDTDDVLWDQIERSLRRPSYVVGPFEIARRWINLALYPGQSLSGALPRLELGERLAGDGVFEMAPEKLQASLDDSRQRWEAWCAAVWEDLSTELQSWMVQLGSEETPDPFDQDSMYLWDRLPTHVVLQLRAAANRTETSPTPHDCDWGVWSEGDDRSPRGVARCLTQWVVDTGRTADGASSGSALVEKAVFGPNTDAVLAFLESVRDLDHVQLGCLRSALPVGWMHEPSPLVDARTWASVATFELELYHASMHLSQEVMIITGGPVPALLDRAEALLVEGLVDDAIGVELSRNWAEALAAAERIRAEGPPDSGV